MAVRYSKSKGGSLRMMTASKARRAVARARFRDTSHGRPGAAAGAWPRRKRRRHVAVRPCASQRRGLDGEHVVAVLFGGAHHGHRRILPGLEVGQRIDDECQFQGLAAAAEQVPLKMQLLGHAAGQASSASGAVRSVRWRPQGRHWRPTTP